eukprot:3334714-Amphidinium_carterae.1
MQTFVACDRLNLTLEWKTPHWCMCPQSQNCGTWLMRSRAHAKVEMQPDDSTIESQSSPLELPNSHAMCGWDPVGKEIAVDVEHHDLRSYYGFVCLVQISTRNKDFIVDPFNIFAEMHMLNEVFSDPGTLPCRATHVLSRASWTYILAVCHVWYQAHGDHSLSLKSSISCQ